MKKDKLKLRVATHTAHALRKRLISESSLNASDVRNLIKIIDDVYQRKQPKPAWAWVLLGAGLTLLGIVFFALLGVIV